LSPCCDALTAKRIKSTVLWDVTHVVWYVVKSILKGSAVSTV
jgi:hypothetical protein